MLICVKLSWFNEVCTLQYIYVLCYDVIFISLQRCR